MATRFGDRLADLRRRQRGQSLRQFCQEHGFNAGNISKLERGKRPPPQSEDRLNRLADALELGDEARQEFIDLAKAERGEVPEDLLDDDEVVEHLPVMFRTLRGDKVDGDQLEDLVELIRKT